MIHATHEQTNLILRGGKRKKHMKNNKKNTTNTSPSIVLYPSPQWKKRSEHEQNKYHDRMKNNKSFNKKNKNMIYNEKTLSKVLKSKFSDMYNGNTLNTDFKDKFSNKFKKNVTQYQYNEYIDKYVNLTSDELTNLKDAYLNYYNNRKSKYEEKKQNIMKKHKAKKDLKHEMREKREERVLVLNSKLDNMKMGGSISQMEKKQFERARMSYIIDQCNQFYKYEYIDGIKQFTYSNTELI